MSKLVGISGYDAALPDAYQVGAPLGPKAVGVCGCSGGVGKLYDFRSGPTTMSVDVPLEAMTQDFMSATRIERIATTLGLGILVVGGLYLVGRR